MILERPNCWKCEFFRISWDRKFPYKCEALGFKSQSLPCIQVMSIDGRPCQAFQVKQQSEMDERSDDSRPGIKGREMDRYV